MVAHQGGRIVPHRPEHDHIPSGGPGGPVGDRYLHRHLGPEGSAGAPGPRRAAGVGGGAERVAGARDPESARLDPELGGAARPRRATPTRTSASSPALIVRESDRLSRLLSEFLDFARVRATQFVPRRPSLGRDRRGAAHPGPSGVPPRRGDHDRGEPDHAGRRRGPAAPGHREPGPQRGPGRAGTDPHHGQRGLRVGGRDSPRHQPGARRAAPGPRRRAGHSRRDPGAGSSTRSSRDGRAEAGSGSPSSSARWRRTADWCWWTPSPGSAPPSPSFCPPRCWRRTPHESEALGPGGRRRVGDPRHPPDPAPERRVRGHHRPGRQGRAGADPGRRPRHRSSPTCACPRSPDSTS